MSVANYASVRALRRVAIGRKYWLFDESRAGGHDASISAPALLSTLTESPQSSV